MKGIIALDIDGTLTDDIRTIPGEVEQYLNKLACEWRIVIVTGRSFYFAKGALSHLMFPFLFLVQNGSLVLKMPKEEVYFKGYLEKATVNSVESAFIGIEGMMLVYAGYEKQDLCFWKEENLLPEYKAYWQDLSARQGQMGHEVKEFEITETPLIKCIGHLDKMVALAERLKSNKSVEFSLIKDPFSKKFHLVLITKAGISKGSVLKSIIAKEGRGSGVIVAGNDDNDMSMFEVANVKIAMPSSPQYMLKKADIIAPPVEEWGIISALEQALHNFNPK
jgi:HAD superfamily hydrolase (TIGR01484 family)